MPIYALEFLVKAGVYFQVNKSVRENKEIWRIIWSSEIFVLPLYPEKAFFGS